MKGNNSMWCNRNAPNNPNNYIWGTYVRPQTPEDKLIRNLAGAAFIGSLLGVWKLLSWLLTPRAPRRQVVHQQDLFKNW